MWPCVQLSSFAYELLNPLLYLGYATKSMITRACANIRIVSDISECADVALVIEAVRGVAVLGGPSASSY